MYSILLFLTHTSCNINTTDIVSYYTNTTVTAAILALPAEIPVRVLPTMEGQKLYNFQIQKTLCWLKEVQKCLNHQESVWRRLTQQFLFGWECYK